MRFTRMQTGSFSRAEIYDGHGGREAAEITSRMLTPYFMHAWAKEFEKHLKDRRNESELIREAYLSVDAHLVERGYQERNNGCKFVYYRRQVFSRQRG